MALAGRSLVLRGSSASLGTDLSQPFKAQLQTLGLAKRQLLQNPARAAAATQATSSSFSFPSGCSALQETRGKPMGRTEPAFHHHPGLKDGLAG